MTNPYCEALRISVPSLEAVKGHREAVPYSLLIVALLERGGPMTLAEVADRFEQAGIGPASAALASLKRCRPGRAPVYRDGESYSLDPHDSETDLWAFRLGLRDSHVPQLRLVQPEGEPEPLPGHTVPLTVAELDEAWRDASLGSLSAQRVAVCVLDAHGGGPMAPADVVAFVSARSPYHRLKAASALGWHSRSPVQVRLDGQWELMLANDAVRSARRAIRSSIEKLRQSKVPRQSRLAQDAHRRLIDRRRREHREELAGLSRVLVHGWPADEPQVLVLIDVRERRVDTFWPDAYDDARKRIDSYDHVAALGVRSLLPAIGLEPGARRLADLNPPQKTMTSWIDGTVHKLSVELLLQSSCGISLPRASPSQLRRYLDSGREDALASHVAAEAKALLSLYEYGRLHGLWLVQLGAEHDALRVPWVDHDERTLDTMKREAHESGALLEIVAGSAPDFENPWARARRCSVAAQGEYRLRIVDEHGYIVIEDTVQAARIVGRTRED